MLHPGDSESIELSLDTNEALDEMQMNQPWCNDCQVLKRSLEDLQAACNHQTKIISDLKQKIIPTDQLITDFYLKQEENQMLTKSLETCRRHCEELDQQLRSALARLEPLREANGKFERQIQRCEQDIEKLKAENEAFKICQQQSNLAHNTLQEKLKKIEEEKKDAQANLRRSEARLKKHQDEMAARKKENSEMKKENTVLQNEIKALKSQLEKFKNNAVPCKTALRNIEIQSPSPNVPAFYDREISSLLTCPILQMLPPLLSPIPSSDAEMSDSDASDNDLSINHFASQLEAKFGCSDDNLPPLSKFSDNNGKDIRADNDDDDESDDETDFIPIHDEVNVSKANRELPTAGIRLESQRSTGFETLTDEDDLTPQISSHDPERSSFAPVSSSVQSTLSKLDSVPSNRPLLKITTGNEQSDGIGHSSAELRLSSSSSSGVLSSTISIPLCTTNASEAPVMSSKVIVTPSSVSMSSTGDSVSSPSLSKSSLPPVSASNVHTPNQNSSGVFDIAASTNLLLPSDNLTVGASEVLSCLASHEIPVTSAFVPVTSSQSNSLSPSQCGSVVTQCANVLIPDLVLHSSSRVHGVNSGIATGASMISASVSALASNTMPRCSPCVMDATCSISSSALPCVSAALSNSASGINVVTFNSSQLCSPSMAETSVTTDTASMLSRTVTASTTCSSVLVLSSCVTFSKSTMSYCSSLSSHSPTVSHPTSVSLSSCTSKFASGTALLASPSVSSASLKSSSFPPSEPDARSEISIEDIFQYVRLAPPLSPIHSPLKSKTVPCKPAESTVATYPQHTEDSYLPSATNTQVSSPLLNLSRDSTVARRKTLLTLPSVNHLTSGIDTRSKAVKQKSSIVDVCPVATKFLRNSGTAADALLARDESDSAGRVQSCLPQSEFLSVEKENSELPVKTNAADHQVMPLMSIPAIVLPTIQASNTSELIESVIKEALMLNEDVIPIWFDRCANGQTPASRPWLTLSQLKLLTEVCRPGEVTVLKEFCERAVQVLSRKGDGVMTSGNTALCCIFVSICRILGDVERVRTFVYDAVKCQFCGYASLVTAVAAIWPFPLQLINSLYVVDFSPVFYALQHAICAKSLDASKPKHQKMQFCLERLCGWSLPLETVDDIARHLLAHLKDTIKESAALSQEVTWNVELAFDLLSVTEGWQWSNNFVVVQLLWPILGSWASNPAEAKDQLFIEAVISILGRVMSHCPAACRSNTDHILNILLTLLKEPTVVVSIQLSVLRALLLLAKYQPDRCATMCLQWVKDHKNDLDPITKAMLRDFHKQFSSRLKYLSELVID